MARSKVSKVFFFLDSRATYSYSKNIIAHIKKFKKINYGTVISGTYLDKNFGNISKNFLIDKIKITKKIKFKSSSSKDYSWAYNFGEAIKKYSIQLSKLKPNLVILTGDRIETLAFCITCTYMNIPTAHIQAGDKSGHIDDLARGAIAKFTNVHFASCENSKKRLISWGEEKNRIFNVGAPQLDDIHNYIKTIPREHNDKLKNILLIFHPVLNEIKDIENQFKNLLSAILKFKVPINFIYPNNDMGHHKIIRLINKKKYKSKINIFKNLTRKSFLKLLTNSSVLVGNSSCGILEAPSFKIPVINIGTRQNGRPQANNIVNSSYNKDEIVKAIKHVTENKLFKKNLSKVKNIFYKKDSGLEVCKIINRLLAKKNNKIFKKF